MDSDEIICVICLDSNNENDNPLSIFDHCGTYYVHLKCQQKWFSLNNTCFICRENIILNVEYNPESEINLIIVNNNNNNHQIYLRRNSIKFLFLFLYYIFVIFIIINQLYYLIILKEENEENT